MISSFLGNTMTQLFTPLTLSNGTVIKNRLFKSAMNEQLADGTTPNLALIRLYDAWAKGGAGVLVSGNVMVDKNASTGPNTPAIEDERDLALLTQWAKAGKQDNTVFLMQINHPGKQAPKDIAKTPVAPSAIPIKGSLGKFFNPPKALTHEEILAIIDRFATTAKVAEKAGFSGVQIHAAHGYLISQFLSPLHNVRDDQWGGSLENRMRFLLEIYQAIKAVVSADFIVALKLNSADFQRGGFSEEESLQVLQRVAELGIDLLEISGGNYESPAMMGDASASSNSTQQREAYFLAYAKKARALVETPLVVTGGIRSEQVMQEAIASGACDMVGLAKPFALVPDLPNQLQNGTYRTVDTPKVKTGVAMVDSTVGSMLDMGYYMYQMARIANRQPPKPLGAWQLLGRLAFKQGTQLLKRERA